MAVAATTIAAAAGWPGASASGAAAAAPALGLGFSLYGMKSLAPRDALRTLAEIGYDCVELPVMADWPADSRSWGAADRVLFRRELAERKLRLGGIMENLPLIGPDVKLDAHADRLRRALALARELAPKAPPPVETILGGAPARWDATRQELVERLGAWAKIAAEHEVVVAIKPHVAGAMHRPEHAAWVLEQVASPWIRAAFDYSHYELRGIPLAESVKTLAKSSVFVHVKDARGTADKFQFLLPGEGATDYAQLLAALAEAGYRGDVVVEVSGQIHSRPDYDPVAAARKSFSPLAAAFTKANLSRRSRV